MLWKVLAQIGVAGVLGACASVGVALFAALLPHSESAQTDWIYRADDNTRESDVYCVFRSRQFGRVTLDVMLTGSGATWCWSHPDPGEPEDLVPRWAWPAVRERAEAGGWFDAEACGWPALCLWDPDVRTEHHPIMAYISDWCYEWFGVEGTMQPRRVIWTGMAANTMVYGSAAWALVFGPWRVRRVIRGQRGRCLRCGYDLRDLPEAGCPECGEGRAVSSSDERAA